MKKPLSLFFVLLVIFMFFFSGCAKKSPGQANLSPKNWAKGEMEKYTELYKTPNQPHPLAEGTKGLVVETTGALAVRAGLVTLSVVS